MILWSFRKVASETMPAASRANGFENIRGYMFDDATTNQKQGAQLDSTAYLPL